MSSCVRNPGRPPYLIPHGSTGLKKKWYIGCPLYSWLKLIRLKGRLTLPFSVATAREDWLPLVTNVLDTLDFGSFYVDDLERGWNFGWGANSRNFAFNRKYFFLLWNSRVYRLGVLYLLCFYLRRYDERSRDYQSCCCCCCYYCCWAICDIFLTFSFLGRFLK